MIHNFFLIELLIDPELDKDLSDFITDDEKDTKVKTKNTSASSITSDSEHSEEPSTPKPSILSQLAPELINDLKNNASFLTLADFQEICKLFIKDNLNSKSIDAVYSCDSIG